MIEDKRNTRVDIKYFLEANAITDEEFCYYAHVPAGTFKAWKYGYNTAPRYLPILMDHVKKQVDARRSVEVDEELDGFLSGDTYARIDKDVETL